MSVIHDEHTLCLVTCGNYRRELEQLLRSDAFDDVELLTAVPQCGRAGGQWHTVLDVLPPHAPVSHVRLFGCACLGTPDTVPPELSGLHYAPSEHGAYLFAPKDMLDRLVRAGSYLVTPGWLLTWRPRLQRWGFDEKLAREYFAESATKIVLLDTGIDPESTRLLMEFAEFVQLPYTSVFVGLDMVRLSLWKLVLEWRLEQRSRSLVQHAANAERQKSDYAMAMDILGDLARTHTETDTIAKIVELFSILFAPKEIGFYDQGFPDAGLSSRCSEPSAERETEIQDFLRTDESHRYSELHRGFLLRFSYNQATLGVLVLSHISFPEFEQHYVNLSLTLSNVCGLALRNARTHDELLHTNEALRSALADVHTLSGLVPICSYCKKIRDDKGYWNILEAYIQDRTHAQFSHGVCPDCRSIHYPSKTRT